MHTATSFYSGLKIIAAIEVANWLSHTCVLWQRCKEKQQRKKNAYDTEKILRLDLSTFCYVAVAVAVVAVSIFQ